MSTPGQRPPPENDPTSFSDLDRNDVPDAKVSESDTAWALWQDANTPPPDTNFAATQPPSVPMPLPDGDRRYARTVPQGLMKDAAPSPLKSPSAQGVTIAQALAEARRSNRVCPQPQAWQKLYEMLPGKRQDGRNWEPMPPLTGSAWAATASIAKRVCLRDHIEWAARQGCLDAIYAYLKDLPESDWYYME
jgi:hypothetical protein